MLFIQQQDVPHLDVIFVDEAQDLTSETMESY
jgi:hypothetical protein